MYSTNSQIKLKNIKFKSGLCHYCDAYILVKRTITFVASEANEIARATDRNDRQVIFKSCGLFAVCISEASNTKSDNAKDFHFVMLMYNLIEYNANYSKLFANLYQLCRDDPKNLTRDSELFKLNQ